MRVLLTGPSGFIGRHAIPHLLAAGWELHTVDIRPLPAELPEPLTTPLTCLMRGKCRS